MTITLANEARCEEFKSNFTKFDYLWRKDLKVQLKEFLDAEGKTLSDGTLDDPPLAKFEEQIGKFKAVATEIGLLPSTMTIGWCKINAKPLRTTLSTWSGKWVHNFTHYLQVRGGAGLLLCLQALVHAWLLYTH